MATPRKRRAGPEDVSPSLLRYFLTGENPTDARLEGWERAKWLTISPDERKLVEIWQANREEIIHIHQKDNPGALPWYERKHGGNNEQ